MTAMSTPMHEETSRLNCWHTWPLPAKVISIALATPLLVYTYKCTALILLQHELIYLRRLPPGSRNQPLAPAHPYGLVAHNLLLPRDLHARDPQLHGLLVHRLQDAPPSQEPSSDMTILYLQGNGGNIAHRHAKFRRLLDTLALAGVCNPRLVAVGYRGYGHSRGTPSERGLIRDATRFLEVAAAMNINNNNSNKHKMVVYGHSLGGAVALSLLASSSQPTRIDAVVLENTFTSIQAMLQHWYPRSSPFHHLHPFLRSRWDSLATIASFPEHALAVPRVALIAGERDDMVPHAHMVQLRNALALRLGPDKVAWYPVAGGMHNTTWESGAWRRAWSSLARDLMCASK